MPDSAYIIGIFIIGALFFSSATYALYWASKNGQLKNFDKNAKTIFDAEEPEGMEGDTFPGKGRRKKR